MENEKVQRVRITDENMQGLEDFIWRSPDATPLAKRIIIWLLGKTEGLTKTVGIRIIPYGIDHGHPIWIWKEVSCGFHNMCSSGSQTRLDFYLKSLGTNFYPIRLTKVVGWGLNWGIGWCGEFDKVFTLSCPVELSESGLQPQEVAVYKLENFLLELP